MYNYRVVIKTQDNKEVKTVYDFKPEGWTELIESIRKRYDYILTLQRRIVFQGKEANSFITDFRPDKKNYVIMQNDLVISQWDIFAEINTIYNN